MATLSGFLVTVAAVGCFLLSPVCGEVELMCPQIATGATEYTELTAGPRTIVFRETVTRQGSPFRLSIYRNTQECVVLDHIPYQSPTNNIYYITVDIPDFTCSRANQNCRLVLRQIDTGSNGGYCQYPSACTQYNSTALISVRASSASSNSCPSRRRPAVMYNWPNDPSRLYTATLQSSTTTARASGRFVLVGNTLLYNVTMTVPFNSPTRGERLRFFYYPVAERAEIVATVDIDGRMAWHAGSWRSLSSSTQQLFTDGQLYVDIITSSTSTNGDVIGQITPSNNAAAVDNLYGLEYGSYISSGWLVGSPFTGPSARATFFARPEGPCINQTRYFGCMLTTSITNGGGTFGLSLTGTRMVFGVDLFNVSTINSVNILGTATDTLGLVSYWSDGYRVNGVLDITSEQQSRITTGLASVEISTRNGQLKCDLQEGIVAFLDSGLERPPVTTPTNGSGTAFISFSVSGSANVQITINSISSPLTAAHLHGPAYQGLTTSSIPFDMSSKIAGQNGSSWNIRTMLTNFTAAELRYFIEGLYYLNMHTTANPSGELRGQASVMGWWACPSTGTTLANQCKYIRFSLSDRVRVDTSLVPAGVGAVVIDRIQRLQISLAFWYVPVSEPLQVLLTSPKGTLATYTTQMSTNRANVQEVNVYYPADFDQTLSDTIFNYALQGRLAINVTTPTYTSGYLYSAIPPLQQNQCGEDFYTIAVGGANGWISGQDYFPLRVLQNDVLNFTFSSPDAVYLMENRNRYDGCVFATATLLSATPGTYRYMADTPGTQYIASNSSCQAQRPMKFPVYVVATYTGQMLDTSTCSQSLYSYTADQRYVNSGSSTGLVVAAIFGLVAGIVLVVAVIVVVVTLIVRRRVKGGSADLPAKA